MLAVTSNQRYSLSPKLRWYTGVGSQINLKSVSVSPNSASSFPPSGFKKIQQRTVQDNLYSGITETQKNLNTKMSRFGPEPINNTTTYLITYSAKKVFKL